MLIAHAHARCHSLIFWYDLRKEGMFVHVLTLILPIVLSMKFLCLISTSAAYIQIA